MKLMKMNDGNLKLIQDNGTTMEADSLRVTRYMWEDLEIDEEEIEFALAELDYLHMDTAHFGINGTFTHCTNSGTVKRILAELKAVQSLRREFADVYKGNPQDLFVHDTGTRLLNMYIALNVDAVVQVLESAEDQIVA